MDADLMELVKNSNDMVGQAEFFFDFVNVFERCFYYQFDDEDDYDENADDDQIFEKEFSLHKRDYYIKKLKYPEVTPYGTSSFFL